MLLLGLAQVVGHGGVEPPRTVEGHAHAAQYEHVALDIRAADGDARGRKQRRYVERRVGEGGKIYVCRCGRVATDGVVRQCDAVGRGCHGLAAYAVEGHADSAGLDGVADKLTKPGLVGDFAAFDCRGIGDGYLGSRGRFVFYEVEKSALATCGHGHGREFGKERFKLELGI